MQRTISTLKGLRILSSDKVADGKKMYQEVIRAMPTRGYETLMVVRSEGNDLSFFVVESGDVIRELLLVSGGGRDFFMLSLVGNLDLKQISRLSKSLDVQGLEKVDMDHSYLVTSNHQSWADILMLQYQLSRRMPILKFFLKQELIWVPVIGLCWWALEFPFMKRFSKEYLVKMDRSGFVSRL